MNSRTVKMSIVLPIYNVERYLRKCLSSVVNQTLEDIEIICVNDGSTDNSLKIIEEFSKKDNRIVLVDKKNEGLGAARNSGLDVSNGEYIWFVDSDDFIGQDACKKIYECGKTNDSDVILIDVGLYWSDVDPILDFLDTQKYKKMSKFGNFTIADAPWIQQTHSVWSRIYRRDFLLQYNIRNPEQRFGEDMLYSYMTSVYAERICILPEKLYFYRQDRKGSLLEQETANDEYKLMYIKSVKETKEFLYKSGAYDILREDFLKSRVRWALPRQIGIRKKKDFFRFFSELAFMLEESDYVILRDSNFLREFSGLDKYLRALEKKRIWGYYLFVKWNKIFKVDYLYICFRIPKTNFTFKIPRLHFLAKKENMFNRAKLDEIRYEISRLNANLEKISTQNGRLVSAMIEGDIKDENE